MFTLAIEFDDLKVTAAILLLLLSLHVCAQRILSLEKLGSGKMYTYHVGDEITLRRVTDTVRFTGTVTMIADSGFFLNMNLWVRLKEVETVWKKFPHRRKSGNAVMIGGGVITGIIIINNLINNQTVVDPVYLTVGAGLVAAGLLWRLSSVQKYPLGKKWKLKSLDPQFL
jgi:hypothetical protein